ncbi:MAG: hypothetical protein HYZ27_06465, partial [Deltaproteobacteria bacterium]|nr:hypothetical protein [Deltaproteobacteria bacterium]
MSKVVHLSEDAHRRAKDFCHERGLKMSDWVAQLIEDAIVSADVPAEPKLRNLMPKKKILDRLDAVSAPPPREERVDTVPAWAQPPFWSKRQARRSERRWGGPRLAVAL